MPDSPESAPPDLMTDRAHSARVYNYLLGGKDNYEADRATGDATLAIWPGARITANANRAFMHRAARFLAEAGIFQFLDVGTGIPTEPNLHQVVQAVEPSARVVYVDNDPIVLAHAAALMVGDARGATAYIDADLRDPDTIIGSPALRTTLDLTQPIGLTLIALLHFIEDDDEAAAIVARLVEVLPAGSYLALSHSSDAFDPDLMAAVQARYRAGGVSVRFRSKQQIERLFGGLDLIEPGVVQAHLWRPDPIDVGGFDPRDVAGYAAIGRKT